MKDLFKSKKFWYVSLFGILYLIVAFSSFFHAVSFFGLANNSWMSIILALAFEIGQAAVLFSLLTSKKDRSRVMPWILMTMFTLVQVIGNVFSSYKYIIQNSSEDLKYFKEPIFIWTDLPDNQATVIIVYLVGALLPIASLLLTSMITNYLSDQEESKDDKNIIEQKEESIIKDEESENNESEDKKEALNNLVENFETKEIDPEIQKVTNEHFDELLEDNQDISEEEYMEQEEIPDPPVVDNKEHKKSHFINL